MPDAAVPVKESKLDRLVDQFNRHCNAVAGQSTSGVAPLFFSVCAPPTRGWHLPAMTPAPPALATRS